MNNPLFEGRPRRRSAAIWHILVIASESVELGREAKGRHHPVGFALPDRDVGKIGGTEPHCGLANRVEHRLQIESRAADDFQHVAGRGLVFERFFEIAGALAQFAE